MEINLELMKRIVEQFFLPSVARAHNGGGERLLKKILETIPRIYNYVPPDKHKNPIVIFKLLDDNERILSEDSAVRLGNIQEISQIIKDGFIVQHLDSEQILVWDHQAIEIVELSKKGVVYLYVNEKESFWAEGRESLLEKLLTNYPSYFCIPTFRDLKDALEGYRATSIRYSSCPIFDSIWFDNKHIFLKNGPEEKMRKSLTHFLKIVMRDVAEVRPEQIVDETHPVDIKITWSTTHKLALIEIKWLGQSKHDDGKFATGYTAARAKKGAKQLAEYLEANKAQAPIHSTQGYLVIVDARRKGLKADTVSISRDHGFYYERKDVFFDPKYHEIRLDFEVPVRMFAEPICL